MVNVLFLEYFSPQRPLSLSIRLPLLLLRRVFPFSSVLHLSLVVLVLCVVSSEDDGVNDRLRKAEIQERSKTLREELDSDS